MPTLIDKTKSGIGTVLPSRSTMLACTFDQDELVCLLASGDARRLRIEAAEALPADCEDPDESSHLLARWLADHGVRRPTVLFGLRRSQVDMFDIALPPARDEELPRFVANQALREHSEVSEQSTLDFYSLDDDPGQSRRVAAAAASAEVMDCVTGLFDHSGLKPAAIAVRPLSAGSLLRRVAAPSEACCMLIGVLGGEVDFSILSGDKVVFSRTSRLPAIVLPDEFAAHLAGEVHRTCAAADLEEHGTVVERIYLFGARPETAELADGLSVEASLPVTIVDPFQGVKTPREIPDPQRYGGLLGMVRDHVERSHLIDFASPKQPAAPPNYRRKAAFYGAAAALVLAVCGLHVAGQIGAADAEIEDRRADLKRVERLLEKTQNKREIVEAVQAWQTGGVQWLDEMRLLSERFPHANDAVAGRITMSPGAVNGSGVMDFLVRVRDPDVVSKLENQLRDNRHHIRTKRVSQQDVDDAYPWQFQATVQARQPPIHERGSPAAEETTAKNTENKADVTREEE